MSKLGFPKSTFYRLFLSFTSLTAIIVLLISIISFILFTSNYTCAIETNSKSVLEYEKNAIEVSVFDKIESIYLDLSLIQTNYDILSFLTNNPLEGNHIALTRIMSSLQECVNLNSNIIDSICIYYQNNNVVISSSFGVKYIDQHFNEDYKKMHWINSVKNMSENGMMWTLVDENPELIGVPNHTVALAGLYPCIYGNANKDTYMVIFVKPNALNSILSRMASSTHQSFIIDNKGLILNHTQKDKVWSTLEDTSLKNKLTGSQDTYKSFICNIKGCKYFISSFSFSNTSWQLVQMIPVDSFYIQSQKIQRTLITISFIVFLIGTLLTYIFSFRIYTPLHTLVSKLHQFTEVASNESDDQNEYTMINGVITKLSIKLAEFEKMLQVNEPMLKHSLISSLFNASIEDEQELREHLKLTGINLVHPHFTVILLQFEEPAIRSLPIKHQQYIKYQLVKNLENSCNDENQLICTVLDITSIGIILNSKNTEDNFIDQYMSQVYSYIFDSYKIKIMAAAGMCVPNPMEIRKSYEQAKNLMKYRCFTEKDTYMISPGLLERDSNKEKIPSFIEEKFIKALNLRQIPDISKCLHLFTHYTTKGFYSSEQCTSHLFKLCQALTDFALNQQYPLMDSLEIVLSEPIKYIWNVFQLEDYIISTVQKIYSYTDCRSNTHNIYTIESLKEYIDNNLNKVLSLDTLADIMHFNPKYLSRLFKETTNKNLTDYINQKRMERAIELLKETHMSVEEISASIGYNSSHYFIKRFKEIYGYTPKSYQLILKKQIKNIIS